MDQIDSYVYLLGTYALLYSLAFIVYQRFKSRNPGSEDLEAHPPEAEGADFR